MDLHLNERVILVTGASRGLGAAISVGLAEEGATVVATARSESDLAEVAERGLGRISTLKADMLSVDVSEDLINAVVKEHGRIDALVNNAGTARVGTFADEDPESWHRTMMLNFLQPMALAQAAAKSMINRGGGGAIVNIASTTGLRGKPTLAAYSASKAAMIRFSEAIGAELARHRIYVNCIAPGAFATDAQRAVIESPSLHAKRVSKIPLRRLAEPEELVPFVCLLVSPISTFASGATFVIDGGESGKL